MPPTTFLFKWEIGHISQFFFGKKSGRPEKTTLLFLLFFRKNRPLEKHRFSEVVEISDIENRKKGQKSLIGALRTPKSFFKNFRSKHMGSPEISVGGLLIMILGHFFEKPVLRLTAKHDIFFENSR